MILHGKNARFFITIHSTAIQFAKKCKFNEFVVKANLQFKEEFLEERFYVFI